MPLRNENAHRRSPLPWQAPRDTASDDHDYEIVLPLMLRTVVANLVARRIERDSP
jgi:hypothetical protein